MRKELILAIILGGFIGIAVGFGIWRFSKSFNKDENVNIPEASGLQEIIQNSTEETTQPTDSDGLTIVRPRANSVVDSDTIQIGGITRPNSYVVIVSEDDYVLQTSSGTFEQEIEVTGGINQIHVYVLTENQPTLEEEVLVTYSSDAENPETAQSVIGTITDLTEGSIQVRTSNGEITQVAVNDDTSYVSTVQTTTDISFEDVAIGDFVAAVGTPGEMEVINAQRVIVSSQLEESSDVIAFGTVQTLTSNDFIVNNEQSGDEWSVDATDSPTVTATNDEGEIATARLTSVAEEGDWIIIVGEMEDDELIARRIHVL